MTARRPAENAEFMLHANHVHVRDVQEIRRAEVGRQVLLRNLKAHFRRVIVTAREIIDRHDEALHRRKLGRHRTAQVRRERGNTAFPWQIIAEERDLADVRWLLHETLSGGPGLIACADVIVGQAPAFAKNHSPAIPLNPDTTQNFQLALTGALWLISPPDCSSRRKEALTSFAGRRLD